jgi:hypothetical protein
MGNGFLHARQNDVRNIHEHFQPKVAGNAHGYCVEADSIATWSAKLA